ncbi:thioesterase [Litorivicinus lipolyticus]|uniref:Thioesterase n=1 Tax=Litorivicinus lipolyticus TaxID=418701 RepID=A0A5Q2Q723_9GAMM|nr:PaaI family thioesterase [Litorivicinus lipolyticus]QGG80159.1 thioesterase [Litorivicinus lipolyticus]
MSHDRFADREHMIAVLTEQFPTWNLMGDLHDVGPRFAVTRMQPQPMHLRPGGTVSGPALFAMADICMYLAILWELGPAGGPCVTADMHSRFLQKPDRDAPLLCTAKLIRIGHTLIVAEATIRPEGRDAAVALFTASYAAPRV